jgi:DNA polymerase-3 subunit epsilon
VFASASWIVRAPANAAEAINRIPSAAVAAGIDRADSDDRWRIWSASCDAIVAHNAAFDRQWLPDVNRPWICTADDVTWPRGSESRSLVSLCLAHGVGVTHAHRALTDCLLIARLLERCAELGHDVGEMFARALAPKRLYRSMQAFADNDKARAHGFRFDYGTKRWLRRMTAEQASTLPASFPFEEVIE